MENLSKIDQITSLYKNDESQLLCFRLDSKSDLYATNVFKIREMIKYDCDFINGKKLLDYLFDEHVSKNTWLKFIWRETKH